jgi:putative membrane protein
MNHLNRSRSRACALAVLGGLAACADNSEATRPANAIAATQPTADPPRSAPRPAMGSTMLQGTGPPDGTAGDTTEPPGSSTTTTASSLDDSQIAAAVVAFDQGEIQEALFAQSESESAPARRFAAHLLTSYQDMLTNSQMNFSRAHLTASDSAVSVQLQGDGRTLLTRLQSIHGGDFDREYIEGQIEAHRHALGLIDEMFPNVKSPQLDADLRDVRSKVYDYLREAEAVRHKLKP